MPTEHPARSPPTRGRTRGGAMPRYLGSLYLLALLGVAFLSMGLYANEISSAPSAKIGATPVLVGLAPPVVGTIPCGSSTVLHSEAIVWTNATGNLTTADIYLKLVELVDGDFIGARDPPAEVTASSACAGDPPGGAFDWFVVLGAPKGGAFLAVFSYLNGWEAVGGAPSPAPIADGSTLTVVSVRSFSNNGYGLLVQGSVGGPTVRGEVTL
jgi:hypothetical protein